MQLGDSNNQFIVVEAGLKEGDEVVLNPLAFIEEAQTDALKPLDEAKPREPDSIESGTESKSSSDTKKQKSKPQAAKPKQADSQSKMDN